MLGPYELGKVHRAGAAEGLRTLPAGSVQTIVTSPPYWGLRDYGESGQWGLEATFGDYLDRMVDLGDAMRHVLRDDGTLWLNMGDCYFSNGGHTDGDCVDRRGKYRIGRRPMDNYRAHRKTAGSGKLFGLKRKDLVGQPWRVAFALQAAGWYLRADLIWHKPNPMPESVKDRPTRAHEYIFLLSKNRKYYYNADAIKEPIFYPLASTPSDLARAFNNRRQRSPEDRQDSIKVPGGWETGKGSHGDYHREGRGEPVRVPYGWGKGKGRKHRELKGRTKHAYDATVVAPIARKRNKRSVWSIPTQPYPGAHFATFPFKLVEPCVLAGCPEGGVVCDPFAGSGTTGIVAEQLGRKFIGFDLAGGDKDLGGETANSRIAAARAARAVDRALVEAIESRMKE